MKTDSYYLHLLKEELEQRTKENSKFSLRAFALFLEVDPGGLSKILSGKKLLTPELADKIISKLDLKGLKKREFLFSMAKSYEDAGRKRKGHIIKKLNLKQRPSEYLGEELSPETYSIISKWYFYAILQLVESKNFVYDINWISEELLIEPKVVKEAIKTLIEQNLLKFEDDKLKRTFAKVHSGDQYYTNEAFKNRIEEITEKSIFALNNIPVDLRGHNTITMAIDPRKIDIAKVMIREFMGELSSVLETKKDKVYELQVNLFPLQKVVHD